MGTLFGQLIVNRFLNTGKFTELTRLLSEAADKLGVFLKVYTNDELMPSLCGGRDLMPDEKPDFVLFYDKDIMLARGLEARGYRLFNRADAIELCDDKSLTHMALGTRVPQPVTYCAPFTYENIGYNSADFIGRLFDELGSPVVIKEVCGSFGQQVYLAHSPLEAEAILKRAGGRRVIFQQFIRESAGRDLRLNVVGGRVIAAMERFNEHGDFRANISNGGSMRRHIPTFEEEELAIRTAEILGLDFCGVDLLVTESGPIVCEVNSNAHFRSIMDCTGVNAADEIMAHIVSTVK